MHLAGYCRVQLAMAMTAIDSAMVDMKAGTTFARRHEARTSRAPKARLPRHGPRQPSFFQAADRSATGRTGAAGASS